MKILITTMISAAAIASVFADLTPRQATAKTKLKENAAMEEYRGSIYAQAKLDGIDYRASLRQAIALDKEAIESLFAMRFMGEGGETHSTNLLRLMHLWDDEQFSKVLSGQPERVRGFVVCSIDYSSADPEWIAFPKTLATSPNSITKRSKEAEQPATAVELK